MNATSPAMITISIDEKKIQCEPGTMLIKVADAAGVYIPRFCYHEKLSIVANCRMCLVEVEGAPKPLPACATPVNDGMQVYTQSRTTLEAQRAVMEFLLINHPLDCPICDQGGECELQDIAMGYGKDVSRFTEGKRVVADEDLGPLVATDMTRCIHCTRCVRFGREVAGTPELGAMNRGDHMEIGTYLQKGLKTELSGNVIDLCPVGALTSKPFRFRGRGWECDQHPSVAAHDGVGSNVYVHTVGRGYQRTELMRVLPRNNEALNQTWLSDRDRFSYQAVNSKQRLTHPMIKQHGEWQAVSWQTALTYTMDHLGHVHRQLGGDQIAGVISPSATLEEMFLLRKLLQGLGSSHVESRVQAQVSLGSGEASFPGVTMPFVALESQPMICLLGSYIRHEQPLLGLRVRQAAQNGAKILTLNPVAYDYNFDVDQSMLVAPQHTVARLAAIARVLVDKGCTAPEGYEGLCKSAKVSAEIEAFAEQLLAQHSGVILLGADSLNHPQADEIRALAGCIAAMCHADVGCLAAGANAVGWWLLDSATDAETAGASQPDEVWNTPKKAYILQGVEADWDVANPAAANAALKQAEFVVSMTAFDSPEVRRHAHVLLPVGTCAETAGSLVNLQGDIQSFKGTKVPVGEARPAWKVYRVLGNVLDLPGFNYESAEEVQMEVQQLVKLVNVPQAAAIPAAPQTLTKTKMSCARVGQWPMYRVDAVVRRAEALQASQPEDLAHIRLHSKTAKKWGVSEGQLIAVQQDDGSKAKLVVTMDDAIAPDAAWVPAGLDETAGLGAMGAEIKPMSGEGS